METPATVRAEAEARGRAAFEAATTEPEPTPEPLSWLWKSHPKEGNKSNDESEVLPARSSVV
jgi:hypothetical protein